MLVIFSAWLQRQYQRVGLRGLFTDIVIFGLAIAVAVLLLARHFPPQPHPAPEAQTLPAVPGVRVVTVDKPVLTEKTVTKVISDPAQAALIKELLAENAKLKTAVTVATVASAQAESHGGGAVTPVAAEPGLPDSAAVGSVHFQDYRLDFTATGEHADYTLTQRFDVLATTGRREDGSPLSLVRLYEQTPSGRVEIPVTQTTNVVADMTAQHWMRGIGLQGGVAVSRDAAGAGATTGVVALQWLSHGKTKAAEDQRYTILAPAAVIGHGVTDIGVIPIAVNLGQIPHQPTTNVWAGVFVAKSQRVGATLTVKF